jgi:hypothetical protein
MWGDLPLPPCPASDNIGADTVGVGSTRNMGRAMSFQLTGVLA